MNEKIYGKEGRNDRNVTTKFSRKQIKIIKIKMENMSYLNRI